MRSSLETKTPAPAHPRSVGGSRYAFCECGAYWGTGRPAGHKRHCRLGAISWAKYRKAFPVEAEDLVRFTSSPRVERISYQPGYEPAERGS